MRDLPCVDDLGRDLFVDDLSELCQLLNTPRTNNESDFRDRCFLPRGSYGVANNGAKAHPHIPRWICGGKDQSVNNP